MLNTCGNPLSLIDVNPIDVYDPSIAEEMSKNIYGSLTFCNYFLNGWIIVPKWFISSRKRLVVATFIFHTVTKLTKLIFLVRKSTVTVQLRTCLQSGGS